MRLVQAALAGEAGARATMEEYLVGVCRIVHARNKRLGSPLSREELLDLVQETQLTIWRRLSSYKGQAALQTWIFGFCHIGMLKYLERRNRRTQRMRLLSNEDLAEHSGAVHDGEWVARESLSRLLSHLSNREAEVARLRYLEQYSFEEIGELLRISISSAKTHCHRALEKLRALLAPREIGGGA